MFSSRATQITLFVTKSMSLLLLHSTHTIQIINYILTCGLVYYINEFNDFDPTRVGGGGNITLSSIII